MDFLTKENLIQMTESADRQQMNNAVQTSKMHQLIRYVYQLQEYARSLEVENAELKKEA